MALRLRAHLPLVGVLVVAGVACTAGLTYAAGRQLATATATTEAAAPTPPLVVPDVVGQAFVFAKGALADAGFAWTVTGSVQGYAANVVATQSPAPGTKLVDTGAPLVTLGLKRNGGYAQSGTAEDVSPYEATAVVPVNLAAAVGPAHPATTPSPAPAAPTTTTAAAPKPRPAPAPAKAAPKPVWPQHRPPAFTLPGGKPEPLDEMPLTTRALKLRSWLDAHPSPTNANVSHWLYQQAWIVAGAKLGWWRGAQALGTLVAVDRRAEQLWGIGGKSAQQVQAALSEVQAKSK